MPHRITAGGAVAGGRVLRAGLRRAGLRPWQAVVVVVLLLAGLGAAGAVLRSEREAADASRQAWAQRAATTLDDEISGAGEALTAVRGLFAASDGAVRPDAFARLAAVELQGSRLLSLNWAPRVTAAGREAWERAAGRPIRAGGARGLAPAAPAPELFPLAFVAPDDPASRALLGIDVAADPVLRARLDRARDHGQPVMTSALSLDASDDPAGGEPAGVGLVAAVYGPDPVPSGLAGRRAGLRGYVGGVFSIPALAGASLAILPEGSRLRVVSDGVTVFDSGEGAMPASAAAARLGSGGWRVLVAVPGGPTAWDPAVALTALGGVALAVLVGVLFAQAGQRRREREQAAARLRHEADTDGLTGLANRRRLERDLAAAVAAATPGSPLALVLLDLNGFKAYNDRFGHPAGDALLVLLAGRLATAVAGARAYRLGGDEFCVLAPGGGDRAEAIAAACRAAMAERGEGFAITAAHGAAVVPGDADTADGAMLEADHRMYARKSIGRQSAASQSVQVLVRALAERSSDLGDHTGAVADLAVRVARRLGVDEAGRSLVRRAALLHDVGKVAVPDAILDKPGPLDVRERDVVRRHTLVGERILRAAPSLAAVAPLVRASHERWDGQGYPDGLAGTDIPLGARIVFACDALEAMTSPRRAYRTPLGREEALDELVSCAGTQFDPDVVAALVAVMREDAASGAGALSPAAGG